MNERNDKQTGAPKTPSSADGSGLTKRRDRTTRKSVRVAERIARLCITIGGMGTIFAVALIFLFLLWIVVPLFKSADIGALEQQTIELPAASPQSQGAAPKLLDFDVNEYTQLARLFLSNGDVELRRLHNGELIHTVQPFGAEHAQLSAISSPLGRGPTIVGFEDGSIRMGELGFRTSFLKDGDEEAQAALTEGEQQVPFRKGLLELTQVGQFRLSQLAADFSSSVQTGGAGGSGSEILRLDHSGAGDELLLAALDTAGQLSLFTTEEELDMFSGESSYSFQRHAVDYEQPEDRGPADWLLLTGLGDNLLLAWKDGLVMRLDVRNPRKPFLAESASLAADGPDSASGTELTSLSFLIGATTLIAGHSNGAIQAWFTVKPEGATTPDGAELVKGHDLPSMTAAVTTLAASQRTRVLVALDADAHLAAYHVTSANRIAFKPLAGELDQPLEHLLLTPREDAILGASATNIAQLEFDPLHPEASLKALFRPVWYEGAEGPDHVWQSSSGTDDFEPKLGLLPLIFGTLKATFYTMLFGAPLALLAAIFTAEFLSSRLKGPLKSFIEMMASLPSVVLGFLAAMVVAPIVEPVVGGVLAVFVCVPFALLLGAHLWQITAKGLDAKLSRTPLLIGLLSITTAIAWPLGSLFGSGAMRWLVTAGISASFSLWTWKSSKSFREPCTESQRLVLVALTACSAAVFSISCVGPMADGWLFGGDIKSWLSGSTGSAWGGWFYLMLPLSALLVTMASGRWINPWLRRFGEGWDALRCGLAMLLKFVVSTGLVIVLSFLLAQVMQSIGWDPRGDVEGGADWHPLGTHVQRNALIVGFIMGFAVIPIIYTIADDALSSVPGHLRLASLGAGATQWQTAMRVVVPTAMSGLFSALMVGLGRAVGETMIVLMATGNTPIRDMNIFNGFRTLSANIAVELPEAVRDSTHYRTLFLAAFVLFAMTFLVNTVAEAVRQRFRKRAFEL